MRTWTALLLAGLMPQDAAAPLIDEDFKDLQDEDAAVRKLSFEELREIKTPSTQARLRKTVGTIASAWLKKAVAELTLDKQILKEALEGNF